MAQHIPLRHDCPYRQHNTAFTRHFWRKVKSTDVKVGDTLLAAAGLGRVTKVTNIGSLLEFTVTGKNGNVRASGSPLTYYKVEDAYLHEDKKCKCSED